ncbi:MAG TPA: ATP-dependent DNA helicase RecG [bacterium]|nr:ATP-dependent DNA helicase RecG [bacterium]
MLNLEDPITKVPLIGPRYKEILEYLGIQTIEDLLYYFPTRFDDASKVNLISKLNANENLTIKAKVLEIKSIRIRGGRSMQRGLIEDESGQVEVLWFNQPFLTKNLRQDLVFLFRGKLNPKSKKPQLSNPEYELVNEEIVQESVHLGRIRPIYALTEGISSKWLRSRIKWVVDRIGKELEIEESLPKEITDKYKLLDLNSALKWIHFPESEEKIKEARDRLGFEEMLVIQVQLEKKRRRRMKFKARKIGTDSKLKEELINNLGFQPTKAQLRVIKEIQSDIGKAVPMNRLLQGDVGSGKTLIAIDAALHTAKAGLQTVILVPTSVLAKQHYDSFSDMLNPFDIEVDLITSATPKDKKERRKKKSEGSILIGTHAILHRKEQLIKDLGLLVIDEQHRFGVKQRKEIAKDIEKLTKTSSPHQLTMTATPIPRSVVLTFFGDIDVSRIDEMPPGRTPTKTHLVPDKKRNSSYKWIKEKVEKGVKVFWITPLIEESDKLETKSVEETYKHLTKDIFPDLKIQKLHGRINPDEKQKILDDFTEGKFQILVSTSVIEVGIDIPDADIIVIEGAERFGLAQLHQLRGRVGRREKESWCFLFTSDGDETEEQNARLSYFAGENDGLKIAEYDLKRRGPGEVYGTKQAGIPNLRIADFHDVKLIEKTREAARLLL